MSVSFTSGNSLDTTVTTDIRCNCSLLSDIPPSRLSPVAWTRQLGPAFGAGATTQALDVAVDRQGNSYVVGKSSGGVDRDTLFRFPDTSPDGIGFLAKYNRQGVLQWFKRFDEAPGTDVVSRVAIDGTNNVYIAGNATFPTRGDSRVDYLIKFDSKGDEQWKITPDSPSGGKPVVKDIAVTASGELYAAGALGSVSWIADYDSTGQRLWARNYEAPVEIVSNSAIDKIALNANGDIFVTAIANTLSPSGLPTSNSAVTLLRFDRSGALAWVKPIETPHQGLTKTSLALDRNSDVYVALSNTETQSVNKYDAKGDLAWSVAQSGTDLQVGKNNYVYLAGSAATESGTIANYKILNASDGSLYNTLTLTGSTDPTAITEATAIALDHFDRPYLAGSTTGALDNETQVGKTDPFVARFRVSGV